jgi:hypothetical protein
MEMAHKFVTAFAELPDIWRAVFVLGGAVAVGATLATATMQFVGLPEEVRANTVAIEDLSAMTIGHITTDDRRDVMVDSKIDRVLCLLTGPDNESPLDAEVRCP